jgi:GntP family gluconate:H+ symporter
MAETLNVDVGLAMMVGAAVAIPVAGVAGLGYGYWIDRRLDIPLRDAMGATADALEEKAASATDALPGFGEALLPIALPVVLIGANTITDAFAAEGTLVRGAAGFCGDPSVALTLAALAAAGTYYRLGDLDAPAFREALVDALKSGGHIIAITAAGGAFGGLLRTAGVGEYIANGLAEAGIPLLMTGWLVGGVIRVAQGSGTVAVLTGASMMAPLMEGAPVHPVYMMAAIGTGALLFSWYNDSGFWIVNEVAGLTQAETLKTWSVVNTVMAVTGLVLVLLLSTVVPLR